MGKLCVRGGIRRLRTCLRSSVSWSLGAGRLPFRRAGWAAAVGAAGDRQRGEPGGERGGGRAHGYRAGDRHLPSFALIGSYELLICQIRSAAGRARADKPAARNRSVAGDATSARPRSSSRRRRAARGVTGARAEGRGELQRLAWQWAQANRASDGSLPSGKPSPAGMAGASAGDGSSNKPDSRAHSPPTSKPLATPQTPGPATQPHTGWHGRKPSGTC